MSYPLTPISDFLQTHLEASRRLSDALFSGTGKLDHAMLNATQRAVDEQLRFAQAIGSTRDPQTYSNLQSTYWARKPDGARSFQKRMMQILAEMQNNFGLAARSYVAQMSSRSMRGVPSSPFGTGNRATFSAVNPFGSAMSAWEGTMRGMSSMAGQVLPTAHTGAAHAGMAVAQSEAQSVAVAATTIASHVPQDPDELDEADAGINTSGSELHERRRHPNRIEGRVDRRRSGPIRRK